MMANKNKKSIKPQSEQKGGTHSARLTFPRVPLREAIRVPEALKEKNGGNPWPPREVAEALDIGAGNNKFFYLTAGSRDYGMTMGSRDSKVIQLTDFGRSLVYAENSQQEKDVKKQAFLNVAPFRGMFDHYKDGKLPDEMRFLSNTLETKIKIPKEEHELFVQIFRDNVNFLGITSGQEIPKGLPSPETVSSPYGEDVVTLVEKGEVGHCFVIIPFKERVNEHPDGFFGEVLTHVITPAAKKAGFSVSTANREGSDMIHSTIVNNLLDADLVIADLTEHNPNVLFELGMRMACDKPVALIRARGTTKIFDVDVLRIFDYDPNLWSSTVEKDIPGLIAFLKGAWRNRGSENTYWKILGRGKPDSETK